MVLTSGLKKIIGTKAFYKAALAFAIPLILQDTVSSFVNLLDNMMIGSLGTEQMSGVAIVNQFINLFTMCIYGGVAGANIFAAHLLFGAFHCRNVSFSGQADLRLPAYKLR